MTALSVQTFTRDVRRAHALISGRELGFFRELLQFFRNDRAARADTSADRDRRRRRKQRVRVPCRACDGRASSLPRASRSSRRAPSCFERGAVNALELRILFVAFVVGAGDARELERADVSRAHDVRPGAEIDEVAVAIERDFFARRNVLDDVELELAGFRSLA